MRIICINENKLAPLIQVGAAIEDLTPNSLWDTPYHLVSMSDEQFQALQEIYGETDQHDMEDVTPAIATRPMAESSGFLYSRGGRIPNATRLRADYLSRTYEADVRNGKVWYKQKAYDSPSKAARAITRSPAITSVSLLASAISLPADMAERVGNSPAAPTIAETTVSTPEYDAAAS